MQSKPHPSRRHQLSRTRLQTLLQHPNLRQIRARLHRSSRPQQTPCRCLISQCSSSKRPSSPSPLPTTTISSSSREWRLQTLSLSRRISSLHRSPRSKLSSRQVVGILSSLSKRNSTIRWQQLRATRTHSIMEEAGPQEIRSLLVMEAVGVTRSLSAPRKLLEEVT